MKLNLENMKTGKKVVRLIKAVRLANYNDLLLLCALASYRCMKLSLNFEHDLDELCAQIGSNNYILGLLDK